LRHRGQNFDSSTRSGSFFRFFVVAYVRDRQVVHASVMIGLLSLAIIAPPLDRVACGPVPGVPADPEGSAG